MVRKVIRNEIQLNNVIDVLKKEIKKQPIIIDVEKLSNQRSNNQLRAFYILIEFIRQFFIEKGNHWTKEEVVSYFKIQSGLYTTINNVKIPKSISDKEHITKEEMENLINTCLEFGERNNIENCQLIEPELREIINNYKE